MTKILLITLMVVAGFLLSSNLFPDTIASFSNWDPFVPPEFGPEGIVDGASILFFAYLGFDAIEASGRVGRGHGCRLCAKIWRAVGLRRSARGLLGDHGRVQAFDAGKNYRYFRRCGWEPVLENGDANERTAHSQRQSDVEHLHGASVVGEHGGDVRHLPRPERLGRHRQEGARLGQDLRSRRHEDGLPRAGEPVL